MQKRLLIFLILLISFIAFACKESVSKTEVVNAGAATKGSPEAPITIIEYSNFNCSACKKALVVLDEIFDEYGDNIYLIYRVFPFRNNPVSIASATAAECARQQDKFWLYHDYLYENQYDWAKAPFPVNLKDPNNKFSNYARKLGLDISSFNQCLQSDEAKQAVLASRNEGLTLRVNSTPTFFINNKRVVGLRSLKAQYKKIFEDILKK